MSEVEGRWAGVGETWHYYVKVLSGEYVTLCGKHRRPDEPPWIRLMWDDAEYKCRTCYRLARKRASE